MSQSYEFGVYTCQRCKAEYMVNAPDTWDPCTPEFCHACLKHLNGLHVMVPWPESTH